VLLVVVGAILPAASASATAVRASGPTWSTATVSAVAAQPTVKLGSRGAAVVALQKRLTALRYDCGSVDGTFGDMTLHGVYAFQKVQRIGVDGIVGPNTWARLARPTVPTPRYTSSKAAVEVNLTLRVVYLTASGVVTRIVDASPGKASTPTPTGSFSILRRINGWRESDLGLLYRPNYFYRGYALHGSTSVPTYAASHGCVRVTVSAMDRLWPVLSIGERLYVYR
jgi:peptidoglycan hydrolase-like protein with peptidoglycan-binding domain